MLAVMDKDSTFAADLAASAWAPLRRWVTGIAATSSHCHVLAPPAVLAALAGMLALQGLARLPDSSWFLGGIAMALAGLCWPPSRLPACCLLGACWFGWRADLALAQRLPPELEGVDIVVELRVLDLPDAGDGVVRLDGWIHGAEHAGRALPLRGRVRLSWFGSSEPPIACSRWRLPLRLKRPRGGSNPGGLDFERYALQQGLVATGYVREVPTPQRLQDAAWCIDRWRERIAAALTAQLGEGTAAHLLRALAVGDQRGISEAEWQVLRATGVGHLIAISGLHVSLLGLAGAWLARLLWRCRPHWTLRWPAVVLEMPAALAGASLYAALAGFGVATARTWLMIVALSLARLLRRHLSLAQGLTLALAAVLAADPLALLSAGFWLSYAGVALLAYALDRRRPQPWWRELLRVQAAMSLGLLPATVALFGQCALVGPLANLVAVPWISLVVVPLTLVGALLAPLWPMASFPFVHCAAIAMDLQWLLLQWLAQWPLAQWHFAESGALAALLGGVAVLWLLLPRGWPLRGLGLMLLLPLLWPRTQALRVGEFELTLLDVGQGLAVLVRTQRHALLYDSAAKLRSGFDLGEAVVVPAAHALGLRELDLFVLSHADLDHAGGAGAVLRELRPRAVVAGDAALPAPAAACRAGQRWQWDGVDITVLHPPPESPLRGNDGSCVLLIESGQARLLLTGDISAAVEAPVAAAAGTAPLVLLAPHHGSKTSSSAALLDALGVQLALVSAGHRNRFGHPHATVLQRYRERGIAVLQTADSGCIQVLFAADTGPQEARRCRPARRRYWNE